MPAQRLIKHNPLFMSAKELESTFVVRQAELQILAELVRGNKGEVNQHALVIGPRGMGKTMLMQRLALLVRSDEALNSSWYPIVAPEEIYDAKTEGEIWLAILKSLADQQRGEDGEFERWIERYETLLGEHHEERLRASTLGALTEFSHERGKRLLVLIENLQMLLGEQFAEGADWDLRRTLLNRPEIMLVLTATARFERIEQPAFAAYELLRELELKSLSTADCRRLWQAVSGQLLADLRIRPMEILTGGNPRLLAILATFAPEHPLQELLDNLAELIDDHTPFLKSNIDALPPQERRVFVNLAKLWEPSTARQVGERARLNSNTTSAVLKSLGDRGIVVECGKRGRGKLYQVAERIYCIYYLMRLSGSEADRMRAFVRFMVQLYGEEHLARSLAEAACASDVRKRARFIEGYRELLSGVVADTIRERVLEATPRAFLDLPEAKDFFLKEATELAQRAYLLWTSGRSEEAVDACDEVVHRFAETEDPVLLAQLASALVTKGRALTALDRPAESVEAYDGVVRRTRETEDPALCAPLVDALFNKGLALEALGRPEEALETYNEVVRRFSDTEDTELLARVAGALVNKGHALDALGHAERAVEAYDDVLRRFSETEEAPLLVVVALALVNKGATLKALGRAEEAIDLFDEVVRREVTALPMQVAMALVNKGVALEALGRLEEEVETYDYVVRRFSETENEALLALVALALFNKGVALEAVGCPEEAVATYDDVVRRFSESEDTTVLAEVARALVNKGLALEALGRSEEAIATCNEVVSRFSETTDKALLAQVAGALVHKGNALDALGCSGEAVETYNNVVSRFSEVEDAALLIRVAGALVNKGVALEALGRLEEAVEVFDEIVLRYSESKDGALCVWVAEALVNKGDTLGALGCPEVAVETYDEVVRRFSAAQDSGFVSPVAAALNGKSWMFYRSGVGRLEEAIEAGERAVELDAKAPENRHTLASVYGLSGRWDEAFEQIQILVNEDAFGETHLDDMLTLIIDAAADGQAERAWKALSGTAAERAMEPLVVALKELAGEGFRAPREVEEVKRDVLVRIEIRRREMAALRARFRDA